MADNIDKGLYQTGAPELEIIKSETEVEIDGQRVPTPEGLEIEMMKMEGQLLTLIQCPRFLKKLNFIRT
jgi:hypothetical protein